MSTPVLIATVVGCTLFGICAGFWVAAWILCEWVKGWGK